MTPQKRFWLGFWAFAPLVALVPYIIFMFIAMFGMMSSIPRGYEPDMMGPEDFMSNFFGFYAGIMIFAFLLSGLNITAMIMYLIHAAKDKRPDAQANRTMWILLIVLLGTIGRVVYYFVRVRTDVGPPQPLPPFQVQPENQ